ncbi:MAG TPA: DNA gyrase C-terminal beta-propeller domain-containing protein, partial [Nitrospira sp.]|nr:DNA gyrase C-terminal beta-propeller domain-containing protein [Nitrospira sp.]
PFAARLSEIQANAILEMRLQRLTQLERDKLVEEYREVLKTIEYLRSVLGSEALVRKIIQDELIEIKDKYQDERRTKIVKEEAELTLEDLIAEEEVVVTISHAGYIKRNAVTLYRAQRRGGKGKIAMGIKRISSKRSLRPRRMTHCSSSPMPARSIGSKCTKFRKPAGPRRARHL